MDNDEKFRETLFFSTAENFTVVFSPTTVDLKKNNSLDDEM